MPSIGSILSTARTALLAQQAAVQVTSHNIANASTDGYSRQRVMLATSAPVVHPNGSFGTGVAVHDVSRMRDSLLDTSFRDATTGSGYAQRRFELLSQVEGLLMEPSELGLGASLDAFFNSWSDLASNPTSATARTVVRESASRVVAQFQRLSAGIDQVRQGAELRLKQEVAELNTLSAQVSDLNVRILATESAGQSAPDLRDARDRVIDRMSSLVPVEVIQRQDGSVGVSSNGVLLADGGGFTAVEARASGTAWSLHARGQGISIGSGSIGAAVSVLNIDLPAARSGLDQLARGLAEAVNSLHGDERSVTPNGNQGGAFFNVPVVGGVPSLAAINADNISLSAAVLRDTGNIAAGFGAVDGDDRSYMGGAVQIAAAIAQLRDALPDQPGVHGLGGTPMDFYASFVTGIGSSVRGSADNAAVQQTMAGQADLRRTSISGVSIDEELVNLIRFQNSYSAAARMITVADEMMQTILGLAR